MTRRRQSQKTHGSGNHDLSFGFVSAEARCSHSGDPAAAYLKACPPTSPRWFRRLHGWRAGPSGTRHGFHKGGISPRCNRPQAKLERFLPLLKLLRLR